ncbi:MAG: site-specific DNA-methyltransferase [Chloroflexi bacterium]|nr:site-specific DNA-methyltransferase [Chloroflexota bacterium]
MKTNILYYGDNLQLLRDHIPEESVDLIYLDPPFNSNRSYNVLFKEASGAGSEAQIEVFEDTWHWGPAAAAAYDDVISGPSQGVAGMLKAIVEGLGHNDVSAYLAMMAPRLLQLQRALRPQGCIYLHCDPTAGPYLRVLMDSIFGPTNFRNEIVWRRTGSHNQLNRFGPIHDTLLFFTKSADHKFNKVYRPYTKGHVETYFKKEDKRGKYWTNALTGAGTRGGDSGKPWRGWDPTNKGRHWAIPGRIAEELGISDLPLLDKLEAMYQAGFVQLPAEGSEALPTYTQYLADSPGLPGQDIWAYQPHSQGLLQDSDEGIDEDIRWLTPTDSERLGYQTQKPLGLLERIISASSNPGDVVLDPFCGCGTAVHAAHKLGRKWIGMDITYLAIGLVKKRMQDAFPNLAIEEDGVPVDLTGAQALADHDKYQFQWWALLRLGAVPIAGKKKGADKGIDGVIPILTGGTAAKPTYDRVVVSVKGGANVGVSMLRDLNGTLTDKDPIGIFLTLAEPTKPMKEFAAGAGFYDSKLWAKKFPRIQIITVQDMFDGKTPDIPWGKSPFAKAAKEKEQAKQGALDIGQ